MKKLLLALIFTSFLFSDISTLKKPTPVNASFDLNNTASNFDTSLYYTHNPLLSCTPSLPAVYKIKSPSKLKVIPKQTLQTSTQYQCTYKEKTFSFNTVAFELLSADYFKDEKILRLSFNDVLDPKSIRKGIKLSKVEKLTKTNLKYSILQKGAKEFVLKINEKMGNGHLELDITPSLSTLHGGTYPEAFHKSFDESNPTLTLDPEKKTMSIVDAPQMVALPNGEFALRIFVSDNLTGQSKKAIAIEGVDNFQISDYKYLGRSLRKRHNIKEAYYYHDISSKAFKPNSTYKVTLKKGLTSYYREIKEDAHYTLKTTDRAKVVLFDEEKPYISNKGELSFSSINIDKATLIVERVLDDNLRYFMNFANAEEENVNNYSKEVFSKELVLNQKKNELLKQKFKLSNLSKNELPVGIYKVTIRYEERLNKELQERATSKVLFLSNLGITANIGKKQTFVTVFSLDKAEAIQNAEAQLYGENNQLLGSVLSNEDGVAIIEHKALSKQMIKGIIVKKDNDQNFLALNNSIESPSTSDLLKEVERFKAYVYFQSNIVRPKAKINALLTIKDRDFISASKLPVKVILKELYGKTIHEKVYHTDQYGLIDFNYQLDANDKTGNYRLEVHLGEKLIGKKIIKVEAFLPPKIENSISLNKSFYNIDELMNVNIRSSYLFGAVASNLHGKVSLNARAIDYVNPDFKHHNFSNEALEKSNIQTYLEHHEEILLDDKGEFKMIIKNTLTQKVPSILEAMIGVTIMDDAQPVSAYKKVKIYPYKSMVGLQIKKSSFEKGQKLEGQAILIDPHTGKTLNRQLFAVLKQVEWHYDYDDGHYNWEKETTVVDRFTLDANQTFSRTITRNGDYVLEVHDRLGGHSASESFDVFSWNYSNVSPKNNLKSVEIKFEDKLYQKGDTLEVQIKSPILKGQLLLTLEGEKVDNYKLLTLSKGVAKTSLKITKEMHRGLHLHATVIRPTDTPSALIPFRATGYKFVKPNREAHKIKIEMDLPKSSKSKTTLPITLKTSKPSKVLISIVDRGILQLVQQETPKLFDYFNEEPNKQLSYHDLYDQLLSHIAEGKLVDFGAGDMMNMKQKHVAPDLGKRIKPFMIWSGIIDTGNEATTLDINIPEFNGRASVVAIAINENGIGVSSKEIQIKDDVMIKPSYPLYGLVGDKIQVPLRIFNTTKTDKNITLDAVSTHNIQLDLEKASLEVPANSSKVIMAKLSPLAVGKGNISLSAKYDNFHLSKSIEMPILSPYALSTKTFKGISNRTETFSIPHAYEGAKAYISLSDNLVGALRDDLKYLVSYPYGCAEQTSSKLSAMHHAKAFLNNDTLVKESQNFMLQGIKKLDNMQNYYGEFEYWEGGGDVSSYASLYTAQTLLEISEAGGDVKERLKTKTLKMLHAIASENGEYQGTYSKFHRMYAAYILAEHNQLSSSTANMLFEKKIYKNHFLATFYMAAILKATGKEKEGNKLYKENSYELSKYAYKTYGNHSGNFESNVRDMMLHFIVKSKYFTKDAKDLESVQKEFSNLYSTQDKAIALKALSTYLGTPKKTKVNTTIEVNNKSLTYKKPKLLIVDEVTSETIALNPNDSSMSYSVELVKNLPKKLKNKTTTGQQLSIEQSFIDSRGAKVDLNNLRQGDKLFSKITIANYGEIDHVVLNQRIPACLSIINNNIQEQAPHFKDENINLAHKEIQDDRILHFVNLANKKVHNKALKKDISVENRGVVYSPLLASSIGECKLPATIIEAMYDSRITDHAKVAHTISVKDLKSVKASAPTPSKESFSEEAEALVKKLYQREMSSTNPEEFANYFDFPLNIYFRNKDFSKEQLLADKSDYFKTWSQRVYSNMNTSVEAYNKETKEVKVKISFDYKIYNGKKTLTGKSNHLLTVMEKEGKLLVHSVELLKAP